MAKSRAQKAVVVDGLTDLLRSMKSAVFASVSGYTMADADALREKGREAGVTLSLTKKTLLARALKDAGVDVDMSALTGSILSAVGKEDEVAAPALVANFFKGREAVALVGGFVDGKFVDATTISTLAQLQSRTHQLTRVVGTLNAPISSFVRVLNAVRESREGQAA